MSCLSTHASQPRPEGTAFLQTAACGVGPCQPQGVVTRQHPPSSAQDPSCDPPGSSLPSKPCVGLWGHRMKKLHWSLLWLGLTFWDEVRNSRVTPGGERCRRGLWGCSHGLSLLPGRKERLAEQLERAAGGQQGSVKHGWGRWGGQPLQEGDTAAEIGGSVRSS